MDEMELEEPVSVQPNDVGSVQSVHSVQPFSSQVNSVFRSGQSAASVHQLPSVSPATQNEAVGHGPKVLKFFYQNPVEQIKVGFTPVRVTTDEEANGVVALVTEKAEEYNRRHGLSEKPVQYLTSAVRARSLLLPEVVRHIHKCFTKKGIWEAQRGLRKRTHQTRKALVKVPPNHKVKHEETESFGGEKPLQETSSRKKDEREDEQDHDGDTTVEYEAGETEDLQKSSDEESLAETEPIDLDEGDKVLRDVIVKNVPEKKLSHPRGYDVEDEEEVDDVEEYVPEEDEMKGVLEEKIFGGLLPKAVRRLKPQRKGMSERTGRGGRNETNGAPETVVLGAVNYMLGNTADGERPSMSLNNFFGQKLKKRRKKQHITVDDLEDLDSEDEDYKGPGVRKNHGGSGVGVRKSKRLMSRKFLGVEGPQKEGALVPLEEPNGEEEERVCLDEEEEFAETLPVVSDVVKEEYAESVARESSIIKVGLDVEEGEDFTHKKTQHKENMRKDKIEIEEHGLVHEKVLVKCEEVVKEEMMEMESEVQYK